MPSIILMPAVGVAPKAASSGTLFRIQTLHNALGPLGWQGTQFVHF